MVADLERLEQAYAIGVRLLDGWRPQSSDLAGAPTISDWTLCGTGSRLFILVGSIIGRPTIRQGSQSRTSIVIWLDSKVGWARTISHFYLLGASRMSSTAALPDDEKMATAALTWIWSSMRREDDR
jgi:hypothetical protein